MMHLVTGHAGIEHIKPSDDGAFNAGVVGKGKYVFDLGNKFSYEIVSNNLVKILDGELTNRGRHSRIPVNNYEEVTIENGLQGVKRYDLICARYTKNADTSIESADLVVVKGTSSTTPSDPACVEGNILEDALVDDFPLYRVRLDGLNIVGVDRLFEVIPSLATVNAKADKNAESIEAINSNLGTTYELGCYAETIEATNDTCTSGTNISWVTLPAGTYLMIGKLNTKNADTVVAGFSTTSGFIETDGKSIGVGATAITIRTFTKETKVYFVGGIKGKTINTYYDTNYYGGKIIRLK